MDQTWIILTAVAIALILLTAVGVFLIIFAVVLTMRSRKPRAAAPAAKPAALPAPEPAAAPAPPIAPPPDPPPFSHGVAEEDELGATVVMTAGAAGLGAWALDDDDDDEARTEVLHRYDAGAQRAPSQSDADYGLLDD